LLVKQTEQRNAATGQLVEAIELSQTLWNDITSATRSAQEYLQNKRESDLAPYVAARTAVPSDVRRFTSTIHGLPGLEKPGIAYAGNIGRGMELIASVLDAYRRGGMPAARRVAGSPYARRFGNGLQGSKITFDQAAQPQALQRLTASRAAQRNLERWIVALALLGLALTLLLALLYAVRIVRRLDALGENARRLAFGVPIVPVPGNDEIAELDRIYREMADRIRTTQVQLRHERETTTMLQQALLPELPAISGLQIDSAYATPSAGTEIGGDWFDAFELPGGFVGLSIGDVTGHGLRAAEMMAFVRRSIRIVAWRETNPRAVMEHINAALCHYEPESLVTAFFAVFEGASGRLQYTLAGHVPPLIAAPDETVSLLPGEGTLLGLDPATRYTTYERQVAAGDRLVLYTDGIVELERDYFAGLADLERAVRDEFREPSDNLAEGIQRRMLRDRTPHDDAALLVVTFAERPAASGGPARGWDFDARREEAARQVKSELLVALEALGPLAPDPTVAEIVFGELLSNAVQHTPGPVRVHFDVRDGHVVLAVEDRNPSFPINGELTEHPGPPQWDAENGRGLFLISLLCRHVAVEPTRDGKCTRVVLP